MSIISLSSKNGGVRSPRGDPVWSESRSKGIAMRLEQLLLAYPVGLKRSESGQGNFEATKHALVVVRHESNRYKTEKRAVQRC